MRNTEQTVGDVLFRGETKVSMAVCKFGSQGTVSLARGRVRVECTQLADHGRHRLSPVATCESTDSLRRQSSMSKDDS